MTQSQPHERSTSDEVREAHAIHLSIDRIHCYSQNPRRQINPEYDRIKASIRAEGLDQPLVITQKPGETGYVLQAGGNTRLQILKSLYEETGEERFYWVDCLLKPWVEESTVLLAHLRENELRGELAFIDKALAVFDAKRLFEAELEIPDISIRRLEQLFKEHGFHLGNAVISKMGYAVHTLLPLIPQALNAGLGRPQVEKIRALERAAYRLWEAKTQESEEAFNDVFATLCKRYDAPEWDLAVLQNALENEIADVAEINLQFIRQALEALLSGREPTDYVPEEEKEPDNTANQPQKTVRMDPDSSSHAFSSSSQSADNDPRQQEGETGTSAGQGASLEKGNGLGSDDGVSAANATSALPLSDLTELPEDLGILRQRAWQLALGLAQRHGLGDLVIPLPDNGLGFLLRDVPDPALADTLDPELLGEVSTLWWHLAACAEITVAPLPVLMQVLDAQSVLCRALAQQDAGLLFDSVWTLDPGQNGHQLWRQLEDEDWQALIQLMTIYRQLHRCVIESGLSLWE